VKPELRQNRAHPGAAIADEPADECQDLGMSIASYGIFTGRLSQRSLHESAS